LQFFYHYLSNVESHVKQSNSHLFFEICLCLWKGRFIGLNYFLEFYTVLFEYSRYTDLEIYDAFIHHTEFAQLNLRRANLIIMTAYKTNMKSFYQDSSCNELDSIKKPTILSIVCWIVPIISFERLNHISVKEEKKLKSLVNFFILLMQISAIQQRGAIPHMKE